MSTANPPVRRASFTLSEDWLATLIGLAIVFIIGAGVLGPGPQSEKVSAAAGETTGTDVRALDDWKISATLDGKKVPISGAITDLGKGDRAIYVCVEGAIRISDADELDVSAEVSAPKKNRAQVVLVNSCDAKVVLSLTTDPAIRWPVFELFK